MTYETENLATAIAKLAEKITDPDALRLLGEVKRLAAPGARPAAGDALDAKRWRSFRRAITQRDEEWLNRMDSALISMGLDPDGDELPSDEQVDAAADAAIEAQRKGGQ